MRRQRPRMPSISSRPALSAVADYAGSGCFLLEWAALPCICPLESTYTPLLSSGLLAMVIFSQLLLVSFAASGAGERRLAIWGPEEGPADETVGPRTRPSGPLAPALGPCPKIASS